ncbi:MAG: cell division protein BolA [Coxiella sp. RIFCSPHIGHO2_12_FULL_42_15]|nr:MAG: cell division protein BolA [Coxiella sp. RIFCSPHIGHO2_12_FULL_42_15]
MNNQERLKAIKACLQRAFQPTVLEVTDESHLHAKHEGAKTGKGHFSVTITSTAFTGKTRTEQHRLIYAALGDLMKNEIHALRITCKTLSNF